LVKVETSNSAAGPRLSERSRLGKSKVMMRGNPSLWNSESYYFSLLKTWAKYYDLRVCVFVFLSVALLSTCLCQKPQVHISQKCSVHVACGRGSVLLSDDSAVRYVLPVLRTTLRFHMTEPMGQNRARRYVSSSSPGGDTEGEV